MGRPKKNNTENNTNKNVDGVMYKDTIATVKDAVKDINKLQKKNKTTTKENKMNTKNITVESLNNDIREVINNIFNNIGRIDEDDGMYEVGTKTIAKDIKYIYKAAEGKEQSFTNDVSVLLAKIITADASVTDGLFKTGEYLIAIGMLADILVEMSEGKSEHHSAFAVMASIGCLYRELQRREREYNNGKAKWVCGNIDELDKLHYTNGMEIDYIRGIIKEFNNALQDNSEIASLLSLAKEKGKEEVKEESVNNTKTKKAKLVFEEIDMEKDNNTNEFKNEEVNNESTKSKPESKPSNETSTTNVVHSYELPSTTSSVVNGLVTGVAVGAGVAAGVYLVNKAIDFFFGDDDE